jgi:hypothetical protein
MIDIAVWQAVPQRVAELLPRAIEIGHAYTKIAAMTGDLAGSTATWLVDEDVLICYRPNVSRQVKLGHLDSGQCFRLRDINEKPDIEKEIIIKKAAIPGLSHLWDFGNKALGGPTPLSNGIVSGLMLGGLGYGAGTLAENLFPERYVRRGALRRNLGLLGLGAGAGIGAMNAYASGKHTGKGFWSGLVTRNDSGKPLNYVPHFNAPAKTPGGTPPAAGGGPATSTRQTALHVANIPVVVNGKPVALSPDAREQVDFARHVAMSMGNPDPLAGVAGYENPPPVPAGWEKTNAAERIKQSFEQFPSQLRTPNLFSPVVNVPQFNQAAWGDVQRGMYTNNFNNYTPPQYAAATTGLMTGISTAQRSPIIRPVDVIRGIASAGVGLATANVAGRALSALAGLTPAGQEKLQDMGLWGGMMHAIVPSMFGNH